MAATNKMLRLKVSYITLSAILALLAYKLVYVPLAREGILMRKGNEIAQKIEAYRSIKKNLPNSLDDININKNDGDEFPLYYKKENDSNYVIWFGTTLGESKIYYSDSKKWEDRYR